MRRSTDILIGFSDETLRTTLTFRCNYRRSLLINDVEQARFDRQHAAIANALKVQGTAHKTIESYSFALHRISVYFDHGPGLC